MPPPGAESAGADVGLAERCRVFIPRDAGSHLTPGGGSSDPVTHNSPLGDGNRPGERVSWHPPARWPRLSNAPSSHAVQPAPGGQGIQRRRPDVLPRLGMAFAVMPASPNDPPRGHAAPPEDDPQQRRTAGLLLVRNAAQPWPVTAADSKPATTAPRRNAVRAQLTQPCPPSSGRPERRLRALAPEGSITLRDRPIYVPRRGSRGCLDVPLLPEMPGRSWRPAGRPASAAPRRTGAGGLCRAFAPARVLSGRLRMLAGWKGPVVRENSPDRCHGAVPEAQPAQKGCGWCGQRPGSASAWRQTAVSAVPLAR
jgi:hypothetical protein